MAVDLSPIPAELIVRDPEICSGRPTMRGTRILAEDIARHLRAGTTWEELAEWYPWMPIPDAQEAKERPGTREGDTGTGTGVQGLHRRTEAALATIRERAEADYVTDPDTVTSDLAKDLMQARLDRQALLDLIDRAEEVP